jgi:hypothetical protein
MEEVLVPSQPTTVPKEHNAPEGAKRAASPQEHDTPEGATRTASPEIQEAEEKLVNLEHDQGTATVDLVMACRQFSQVTNQLQEAFEEATRLHESNAKFSEDLEGKSNMRFPSPPHLSFASWCVLTCSLLFQDARVSRRDDFKVGRAEAGAEHHTPQGHREGWCDRALVGEA